MALMECLIKREGPTELTLGKFRYFFQDDGTGAKVADVNNDTHMRYLISTGYYRIADPKLREQVEKENAAKKAAEQKQKDNPDPTTQTPEQAIGMLTRKFLPLQKPGFKAWVEQDLEEIKKYPDQVKQMVTQKWEKLFPGEKCPVE